MPHYLPCSRETIFPFLKRWIFQVNPPRHDFLLPFNKIFLWLTQLPLAYHLWLCSATVLELRLVQVKPRPLFSLQAEVPCAVIDQMFCDHPVSKGDAIKVLQMLSWSKVK